MLAHLLFVCAVMIKIHLNFSNFLLICKKQFDNTNEHFKHNYKKFINIYSK